MSSQSGPSTEAREKASSFYRTHPSPDASWYVNEVLIPQLAFHFDAFAEAARREERKALEESVKLQSHYAELLNQYDGGQRISFKDADDWKYRLAMSPEERIKDAVFRRRTP